jgi:hypothetical protein
MRENHRHHILFGLGEIRIPFGQFIEANHVISYTSCTCDLEEEVAKEKPGLCAHALSVLRDVQKQKDNLEWNLLALSRRHDEQYLYDLVEEDE